MIHTHEQKPSRNHREARRKKYEDATEATNKTHTRVEIKRRVKRELIGMTTPSNNNIVFAKICQKVINMASHYKPNNCQTRFIIFVA